MSVRNTHRFEAAPVRQLVAVRLVLLLGILTMLTALTALPALAGNVGAAGSPHGPLPPTDMASVRSQVFAVLMWGSILHTGALRGTDSLHHTMTGPRSDQTQESSSMLPRYGACTHVP